jgi:hypothetical protein
MKLYVGSCWEQQAEALAQTNTCALHPVHAGALRKTNQPTLEDALESVNRSLPTYPTPLTSHHVHKAPRATSTPVPTDAHTHTHTQAHRCAQAPPRRLSGQLYQQKVEVQPRQARAVSGVLSYSHSSTVHASRARSTTSRTPNKCSKQDPCCLVWQPASILGNHATVQQGTEAWQLTSAAHTAPCTPHHTTLVIRPDAAFVPMLHWMLDATNGQHVATNTHKTPKR